MTTSDVPRWNSLISNVKPKLYRPFHHFGSNFVLGTWIHGSVNKIVSLVRVRSSPRTSTFFGWSGPFLSSIIEIDSDFSNQPFKPDLLLNWLWFALSAIFISSVCGPPGSALSKFCWSVVRLGYVRRSLPWNIQLHLYQQKISIIMNFTDNPGLLIQNQGAGRLRDLSDKIIDGISI